MIQVPEDIGLNNGNLGHQFQRVAQNIAFMRMSRRMGVDDIGSDFPQDRSNFIGGNPGHPNENMVLFQFRPSRPVRQRQHRDFMAALLQPPSPPAGRLFGAAKTKSIQKNDDFHV